MSDAYNGTLPRRSHIRWIAVVVAAGVATGLAYNRLAAVFATDLARRWSAVVVLVLVYELAVLRRILPDESPSRAVGPATLLTLVRGVLVAFLAGFLFLPQPTESSVWLPAALYGSAALADYLDGTVARLTDSVSEFGARLDTEIDALGVLVASLLAVLYGQLPVWYLSAGAARYLFVLGRWHRCRTGEPIHDLPARTPSRVLAGIQMGFLVVVLSPLLAPPAATALAAIVLVPFLGSFLWDWWHLTGRLSR